MTQRHRKHVRLDEREKGTLRKRFALASLAVAAFAAFALASAPSAAAQETIAAQCPPPEDSIAFPGEDPVAQNFVAAASGNLTRAEVMLLRVADTDDPFTVQIWTIDADGNPVTLLSSGTIAAANVPETPDDPALVGVVFATPAPIVAGQHYAIVVQRDDGNYWNGVRENDECPGELRELEGDEWVETNLDLVFRVFVGPPGAAAAASLTCKGEQATMVGTDGDNEIIGTDDRDVIAALGGNDQVRGLGANDLICGGSGRDSLRGGKNKDKLFGQAGKDTLRGQKGKDKLLGKGGKDRLNGGTGKDVCKGGKKDDTAKKCEVEKSI